HRCDLVRGKGRREKAEGRREKGEFSSAFCLLPSAFVPAQPDTSVTKQTDYIGNTFSHLPGRRSAVGMWESRVREISKRLWKSVCDFRSRGISIAAAPVTRVARRAMRG